MNQRIQELAEQAKAESNQWLGSKPAITVTHDELERFAELIVEKCVSTLEFHGFEDAVPYIKWMATNKLGVKE